MTDQITLEKALELVNFELRPEGWRVKQVRSSVWGHVWGSVRGSVGGDVGGDVQGDIGGNLYGTIGGRQWMFIEAPKEALNQLEDSNV